MRIFLAGGNGVVGRRLVPMLVGAGHHVVATTRGGGGAEAALTRAGAEAAVMDGLDAASVERAVSAARPDVVVHQMTALAGGVNMRKFDDGFALTNRLHTEGTDHLLAAAQRAGVKRIVAQSYTGWPNARTGGPVKTEDDPLDPTPAAESRQTLAGLRYVESAVTGAAGMDGIVLRYGAFYGPGTDLAADGAITRAIRRRRFPVVGSGGGVWSFVHIDDVAAATLLALDHGATGLYNIVDDDPAPVREWLPALAAALGAGPPRHLPAWLARPLIGEHGVAMMTESRGSSNAKARWDLEWAPRYPSWRQGFVEGLG